MIRHVFFSPGLGCSRLAPAVMALAVAMIELTFLGLLMPEIGGAQLQTASLFAAAGAAVDLATITMRADEEHPPTAWRTAKALPEKQLNLSKHRAMKWGRQWWNGGGKMRPMLINRLLLTWKPAENPGCYQQPGLFIPASIADANKKLG